MGLAPGSVLLFLDDLEMYARKYVNILDNLCEVWPSAWPPVSFNTTDNSSSFKSKLRTQDLHMYKIPVWELIPK